MKKQLVIGLCLAILLAGCSGAARAPSPESDFAGEPARQAAPGEAAPATGGQVSAEQYAQQQATAGKSDVDPQTGLNRMVIYNADLALIVQDTSQSIEAARKIIQDAGGYIADSNSYRDNELLRASVTARVPAEKLTATLEQLKKIALIVDRESLKGQDVTDQYTDLQSRLRNLEAAEERYLDILKKADKIEDVLAVQRRLDEIRGEIEQTKGRMEYLSKSAAMATVKITLTPDALARPITVGGWRPQGTARNAFDLLLNVLRFLADVAIYAVICILPVGLILGVPLYFAVRLARGRLKRGRPQTPAPPKT